MPTAHIRVNNYFRLCNADATYKLGDMKTKPKRQDLKDARKARKLTQGQLAEKIGKDQAYVSRIESGGYRVDADVAPLIAKALRMSLMRVLYPQ